jgi:hypothetical protein
MYGQQTKKKIPTAAEQQAAIHKLTDRYHSYLNDPAENQTNATTKRDGPPSAVQSSKNIAPTAAPKLVPNQQPIQNVRSEVMAR